MDSFDPRRLARDQGSEQDSLYLTVTESANYLAKSKVTVLIERKAGDKQFVTINKSIVNSNDGSVVCDKAITLEVSELTSIYEAMGGNVISYRNGDEIKLQAKFDSVLAYMRDNRDIIKEISDDQNNVIKLLRSTKGDENNRQVLLCIIQSLAVLGIMTALDRTQEAF